MSRNVFRILPSQDAVAAFWKKWGEVGETNEMGRYEATWTSINAALKIAGVEKAVLIGEEEEADDPMTDQQITKETEKVAQEVESTMQKMVDAYNHETTRRNIWVTAYTAAMERNLVRTACVGAANETLADFDDKFDILYHEGLDDILSKT